MFSEQTLQTLTIFFPVFLFSLCAHEWAHAFAASRLGDPTAKSAGRLTLNPMAHADPIGTLVLPLMVILFQVPIFFGWAKPVPIDPRNFKNPRRDTAIVAAAGPVSNIVMAVICALVYGLLSSWVMRSSFSSGEDTASPILTLAKMFNQGIYTNLFLAFFNLIPLAPLDGAKVLQLFVSPSTSRKIDALENYSFLILMFMYMTNFLKILALPVSWSARFLQNLFYF